MKAPYEPRIVSRSFGAQSPGSPMDMTKSAPMGAY
jgi:hypothetical protein